MTLSRLLLLHAVVTLAAGIVLVVAPGAIPNTVGIDLADDAALIAYLLAAAELAFAYLSFAARRLDDAAALRLVVWTLIAFHASSGVFEAFAFSQGVGVVILGNVAFRAIVGGALWHWGLRRVPQPDA